jgi:photosystem II stability/assembly factor-like uncharacterized protein
VEDRSLRIAFHSALDEVLPPAPWLAAAVRQDLQDRRRQGSAYRPRYKPRGSRFAVAGIVTVVLALAVLAALLLTQLYAPVPVKNPNPAPTPTPPSGGSLPIYQDYGLDLVRMSSSTTGWARGGLRTTDGGQTWRDVSPPALPGSPDRHLEFYLDADHGWQGQIFPDRLVIFRTADGGKSWEQGATIFVKARDPVGVYGLLSFVDAEHGWLVTESWPMGAPHPDPTASGLYKTIDGGIHWTLLSTEPGRASPGCYYSQGLDFVTLAIGWVQIFCPQPGKSRDRLMVTRDGGSTWKGEGVANAGLCAPCIYNPPTFIDSQHWLVLVVGALYMTEDGGVTWNRRGLPESDPGPPQAGLGSPASVSFIDPNIGWAFVWIDTKNVSARSSRLYRTSDGGRHWTLMQSNLPAQSPDAASITFIDATTGFATHRLSTSGVQLLKTTDGGQSWTEIQYHLPSPAGT